MERLACIGSFKNFDTIISQKVSLSQISSISISSKATPYEDFEHEIHTQETLWGKKKKLQSQSLHAIMFLGRFPTLWIGSRVACKLGTSLYSIHSTNFEFKQFVTKLRKCRILG